MNELMYFQKPEFGSIRVLEIDGGPWFVGKDVAEVLGYERPTKAIADHVDAEERIMIDAKTQSRFGIELGQRGGWLINESGLYSLILSSKLPTAKDFKRWVTSEVLPSIRKHGAYMTEDILTQTVQNPDFLIGLLNELKAEKAKSNSLQATIQTQTKAIKEMKPKALFADCVSSSPDDILIGVLAKIIKQNGYDIGQNRLFKWMVENGYLMRHGRYYVPTQQAMEMKIFRITETTVTLPDGAQRTRFTVKVTGKGQQYFVNKFVDLLENEE